MKHEFEVNGEIIMLEYDLIPCPPGQVLDHSRCGIYPLATKYIVLNNGENGNLILYKDGSWNTPIWSWGGGSAAMSINTANLFDSYEEASRTLESSKMINDIRLFRSYSNNINKSMLWYYGYEPSPEDRDKTKLRSISNGEEDGEDFTFTINHRGKNTSSSFFRRYQKSSQKTL